MEVLQKSKYGTVAAGGVEAKMFTAFPSLIIILVGKTGSGKSATGNSILLRPAFESRLGSQSVTRACQAGMGMWNGRNILVVDTPPIFEFKSQHQETYQDIGDCYLLSAPGPHVLLLVTQLGRFTAQDMVAVRRVKEVFGAEATRHMIVLFTHKDDLGNGSLDEYVANTDNQNLKMVVKECGRRYCAFNNRAAGQEKQGQLVQLMAVVERLEQARQGSFLSNDLFSYAYVLQQGQNTAHQADYMHYLAQVRWQVEMHQKELKRGESSWGCQGSSSIYNRIMIHIIIPAFFLCGLIFLIVLINSSTTRRK